jgi:hypothetical protein
VKPQPALSGERTDVLANAEVDRNLTLPKPTWNYYGLLAWRVLRW